MIMCLSYFLTLLNLRGRRPEEGFFSNAIRRVLVRDIFPCQNVVASVLNN